MVFAHSFGPYVIEQENQGVELNIVREALVSEGYELVPMYTALSNLATNFSKSMVNGAQSGFQITRDSVVFYGDNSIEYHDFMFSLEERDLNINQPEDLRGYSLIAFQGAHKRYPTWLPPGYEYSQTAKQIDQVRLLQLGLVDVVLSDKNIFNYNVQYYRQSGDRVVKPMRKHTIANPFSYGPAFKLQKHQLAFNRWLKNLKKSGCYDEILSALLELDPALIKN